MPLLSIVICTRNPSHALFLRVCRAIAALVVPAGWQRELLVVDNASTPPLADIPGVREAIAALPWARVVVERRPGIANARQAGTVESSGELIVWFDDDNEPASTYLEGVVAVAQAHPAALAFGAGRITVEFTGAVSPWAARHAPGMHQSRDYSADEFASADRFARCTPVGSGLVSRRALMERWVQGREEGRYALSGRQGARLDSGEDSEIVFEARRLGGEVGVSPLLALRHLIPPRRTTMAYLARLSYATAGGVLVARREAFGADGLDPPPGPFAPVGGLREFISATRRRGLRLGLIAGSAWLGAMAGAFAAHRRAEPWWLRAATRACGLR